MQLRAIVLGLALGVHGISGHAVAAEPEIVDVESQPLKANVGRMLEALEFLGAPSPRETRDELDRTADARELQRQLDRHVLLVVSLNPESRVKVARGPAPAVLQQAGYTPAFGKERNDRTVTKSRRITSRQSGPGYAGVANLSMTRQGQVGLLKDQNVEKATDRFLQVEMIDAPPMTAELSGLKVEYAIALIYS